LSNIDSGGEANKENKEKGVITFPTLLTMIEAVTVKELCGFNEESRFDVNIHVTAWAQHKTVCASAQNISFAKIKKMRLG